MQTQQLRSWYTHDTSKHITYLSPSSQLQKHAIESKVRRGRECGSPCIFIFHGLGTDTGAEAPQGERRLRFRYLQDGSRLPSPESGTGSLKSAVGTLDMSTHQLPLRRFAATVLCLPLDLSSGFDHICFTAGDGLHP